MAKIKGWKKVGVSKWVKDFETPYYRGGGISRNVIEITPRKVGGYWFSREVNGVRDELIAFDTKQEALDYAITYMRSSSGVSGFYKGMPIVSKPPKGYHKVEGASAIDPKYQLYAKGSRFSGERKTVVVPKKR